MKRFLSIFLVLCTLITTLVMPVIVSATSLNSDSALILNRIGVLSDELYLRKTDNIKRGEVAEIIAKTMGCGEVGGVNTPFSDVSAENKCSGYVSFLYNHNNIISANDTSLYYPDNYATFSEIIKMIVCMLGGNERANSDGGYPLGYISLATTLGILDGIDYQNTTISVVCDMIYNSLKIPLFATQSYVLNGDIVNVDVASDKNRNILNEYLNISIVKASVVSENKKKNTIDIMIDNIKIYDDSFKGAKGDIVTLNLSPYLKDSDYRYLNGEFWIREEDEAVNFIPSKNIEVIYGTIEEINEDNSETNIFDTRYIKNIAITTSDEYLDVADNCVFSFNNKDVTGKGISANGNFARLVIQNDEIIACEVWKLSEGGIVSEVSSKFIYTKGMQTGIKLDAFFEAGSVTTIINNTIANKMELIPDMLFDWFYDEENDSLLLVSSGVRTTDEFSGIKKEADGTDAVIIGDVSYKKSKYGLMCKRDESVYGTASLEELMGEIVTCYVDYAGRARYIKLFSSDEDSEFYGIILGCQVKDIFESEYEYKIARVTKDGVEELICTTTEKFEQKNKATLDVAKEAIRKIRDSSDVNTALCSFGEEVLYKFSILPNKRIIRIAEPTRYDECPEGGLYPTEISGGKTITISSIETKFDENAIYCAYYYENGTMKIKTADLSEIHSTALNNCRFDLYSIGDTSDIEFVFIRGNVASISKGTGAKKNELLMTEGVSYDAETQEEVRKIKLGNEEYFIKGDFPSTAIVHYGINTPFSDNGIYFHGLYDVSGEPSTWETVTGRTTEGLHSGIVERTDSKRIYITESNGDGTTTTLRMPYEDSMVIYKRLKNGKFVKASFEDIVVESEIFYSYRYYNVRVVIIVE